MLHLGHRDCLQDLGLSVFHLSDDFAQDQENEEQNEECCRDEEKAQTRIVGGLIDHHTRHVPQLFDPRLHTIVMTSRLRWRRLINDRHGRLWNRVATLRAEHRVLAHGHATRCTSTSYFWFRHKNVGQDLQDFSGLSC